MTNFKSLQKENETLKSKLKNFEQEIATLKAQISTVKEDKQDGQNCLQVLSNEYDDLAVFKRAVEEELKRLSRRLSELSASVNSVSEGIETMQQYSYQYNVKIVGWVSTSERSRIVAEDTTHLCLKLFTSMGVNDISFEDIDTTHRVPIRSSALCQQ